jgi:hypothetical protein
LSHEFGAIFLNKLRLNLMVFHNTIVLLLITQNTKIKLFLVNRIILLQFFRTRMIFSGLNNFKVAEIIFYKMIYFSERSFQVILFLPYL